MTTDADGNEITPDEILSTLRKLEGEAGILYATKMVVGSQRITRAVWENFRRALRQANALLEDIDGPREGHKWDQEKAKKGYWGRARLRRTQEPSK